MLSCQILLLLLGVGVSAVEVQRPRGVPLSKRQFYEEGSPFTCLDGSRTIPFDRVNDDYCDCQDGSDEPDCCDTTDEYNSGAACQNTCREMGRKERESMQKMAEIAKEGFMLKLTLIQESKRGLEDKKAKHADIEVNKNELEKTVEALRTVKETAEQPEKEAKERHLKAWEDQKAIIQIAKDKVKMAEVFVELDDDANGFVSVAELLSHSELDSDSEDSFTEAEAQGLLGGVDQVDSAAFESVWNVIKDKYISEAIPDPPAPVETPPEEVREPESDNDSELYPEEDIPEEEEDDEEEDEEDDSDDRDFKSPPPTQTQEKKDDDDEGTMPSYDEETQSLIDAAQKARDAFDEAEKALREVDDQIKNLEKEISFDFGPTAEFAYLYSQCYELTTSEYIKVTCGKETVLVSTSEPSRCEYLMEFISPAVCQEPSSLDSAFHDHTEL
ncbi:Glucosidase 2 subunit beta [Liparis tanakae]|uniref:Glucosidase 2 subunit beta n=1 Tax=Liparis tanakae TaxID=230148 RepID=A0A4Z2HYC3_9TELE|nr:Glucosidase 2 subunit beta [Liparis tanakae]